MKRPDEGAHGNAVKKRRQFGVPRRGGTGLVVVGALLAAALLAPTPLREEHPTRARALVSARTASNVCPAPKPGILRRPAGKGKRVALTFDDGPSRFTPQILAILARQHVHGTFFLVGEHVAQFPRYAEREVRDGDAVGNHTWDHPQHTQWSVGRFDQLPLPRQRSEIETTTRAIIAATGVRPCFFRAPGGADTDAVGVVHQYGMSVVNWSNSSGDSGQPATTTQQAVNRLATAAVTGAESHVILLTHDGKASAEPESVLSSNRSNSVAALPRIIRWYKSHGYRFVRPDGSPFPRR